MLKQLLNHYLLTGLLSGLLLFVPLAACCTSEPDWPPEEIQSDFEFLYQTLRAAHYNIDANRSRASYDALYQRVLDSINSRMQRDEIAIAFQRFVAYGNVAHASIEPPLSSWEAFRAAGGLAFPLYFRVMDERVFIDDFSGDLPVKVGDEVLAVDGVPVLRWLQPIRSHLSADNDYLAYALMEGRLPLLVWLELGEIKRFGLTLNRGDGHAIEVVVPALSRDAMAAVSDQRPEYFALDWNERAARMLDTDIAYLRPGLFYDNRPQAERPWDPAAFNAFVDESMRSFMRNGANKLLLDLRNNPGGNNDFSDHLLAWFADRPFRFSNDFQIRVSAAAIASNRARLQAQSRSEDTTSELLAKLYENSSPGELADFPVPWVQPRSGQRFGGEVYILVNRHSYSNAVSVAAIAQDFGFATIIGERTADLANTYGAMEHFTLPHTGIRVGFPKARILRPSGDLNAIQVMPDVSIATPLAVTNDVVLQRAVEITREPAR